MAIKLTTNLDVRTALPIDARFMLTKFEMFNMKDTLMPETYFTICKEDSKFYVYNKNNPIDLETGKFRLYEAGGGSGTDTKYRIVSGGINKWRLEQNDGTGWVSAEGSIDISETINYLQQQINAIDYSIVEETEHSQEFSAVYRLTNKGVKIGSPINIPAAQILEDTTVRKVESEDDPAYAAGIPIGHKCIDFNWGSGKHTYIDLADLIIGYEAGEGITITDDNVIEISEEYRDRLEAVEEKAESAEGKADEAVEAVEAEITRATDKELELSNKIDAIHIAEYEIAKVESTELASKYILTKDGEQSGVAIEIAKDQVLKSVTLETAEEGDPYFPVGTKYLLFVWSSGDKTAVNLQDLVDLYTAGTGINISETNVISIQPQVLDRIASVESNIVTLNTLTAELGTKVDTKVSKEDLPEAIKEELPGAIKEAMKDAETKEALEVAVGEVIPGALKDALDKQLEDSGLIVDEDGNIKVELNQEQLDIIDNKISLALDQIIAFDANVD